MESATATLQAAILSGEVAPGQRLPPERQLSERLGIHRGTLRTALHRLVASGLIAQRQGRGTTVLDFQRAGGPDLLPGLAALAASRGHLHDVARDLFTVRRHLARAVLERLAELRPDPAPVVAAVDAFDAAVASGAPLAGLAAADMDVVAALLSLTGSAVFQLCLNPVGTVLLKVPALHPAMYGRPHDNVAAYRALLAWLSDPDPAGVEPIIALLAARDAATVQALRQGGVPGDWT